MKGNFLDSLLFLPGPQVYSGEHGQVAKNNEGRGFKLPLQERPNPAKADIGTREHPAWPPHLGRPCPRVPCVASVWIALSSVLTMAGRQSANEEAEDG